MWLIRRTFKFNEFPLQYGFFVIKKSLRIPECEHITNKNRQSGFLRYQHY